MMMCEEEEEDEDEDEDEEEVVVVMVVQEEEEEVQQEQQNTIGLHEWEDGEFLDSCAHAGKLVPIHVIHVHVLPRAQDWRVNRGRLSSF